MRNTTDLYLDTSRCLIVKIVKDDKDACYTVQVVTVLPDRECWQGSGEYAVDKSYVEGDMYFEPLAAICG